ncbi:MAG TPA: hypothetical protein VGJ09_04000 [Bryobacteraceae bacterium]|jgi:hypothetical protein
MGDGRVVAFRDLSQTESTERNGHLIQSGNGWAELEFSDGGAPVPEGTPVGLETSETIYLGHVERGEIQGNSQRVRILFNHTLALKEVQAIQKLWGSEQAD